MKVTPIIASQFTSDGGTMFGLVPRPMWSKLIKPDEQNRIKQDAHVLLVELEDGRLGLIDTGCGPDTKFSEKELSLHGLGTGWPLADRLEKLGIARERIVFVVFSHLHWDHAGGASMGTGEDPTLSFPNAVHYVHAQEWADATMGDPLLYKSYPADTVDPLRRLPAGKLSIVSGDQKQILPGITLSRSGGHTRGHCVVSFDCEDGIEINHPESMFMFAPLKIVFAGDVCPMRHNLRMVFQTSYDTYPLETRAWKNSWLPRIAEDRTLLMFDHDPELFGATIRSHERREFVVDKTLHTSLSAHAAQSLANLDKAGRFGEDKEQTFITG